MASPAAAADPKDTKVTVLELLLPSTATGAADARRIVEQVSQCEDLRTIAQRTSGAAIGRLITVRVGDVPPDMAQLLTTTPIGHAVGPFLVTGWIQVLAICSRQDAEP